MKLQRIKLRICRDYGNTGTDVVDVVLSHGLPHPGEHLQAGTGDEPCEDEKRNHREIGFCR